MQYYDADPLSPYSSDHSFTCQNISMVTATVDDHKLAEFVLEVPRSIQDKIREKTSTFADFREGTIEYYVQYSSQATWPELAGRLYWEKCGEALAAARKFIKRTPGNCMYIWPDQLNKLLHEFTRSNFWANRKKIYLSWVELMYSRVVFVFYLDSLVLDSHTSLS